jgi:hypothetical protein
VIIETHDNFESIILREEELDSLLTELIYLRQLLDSEVMYADR